MTIEIPVQLKNKDIEIAYIPFNSRNSDFKPYIGMQFLILYPKRYLPNDDRDSTFRYGIVVEW